jgi:hypothetical protein
MLVNNNIHKSGLLPSRSFCIFGRLTNSNVLGKLPIHDSKLKIAIGVHGKNIIHM